MKKKKFKDGDYASLESARNKAAEIFNTLIEDMISEYLYKKGAFKDLGNRTESRTSVSEEELYDLMTKAYEQHTKNPLGPAKYFEYNTGDSNDNL